MFLCDYHTHSAFSPDGSREASIDALCRAAIARGVSDLAITDHFDANGVPEKALSLYDAKAAFDAISAAKETYKGKLHLTYGVEIGQGNQYPKETRELLGAYPFEFVIGSLHNLRGSIDIYFYDFQKLMTAMPLSYIGYLFERYVSELCEMVESLPKIDTVGHLTYMRRYMVLSGFDYDFSSHRDSLEVLFRKMRARETALEVNVSTLWKGLPFAMPDKNILKLYRECGGELVTVGTDSHDTAHIGACVEQGFALLRECGFGQVMVLREGKRERIKI